MSTTRGGDLTPDGQEGQAGTEGVQAGQSRAHEDVDCNSGPQSNGDTVPEAGAGGIAGASGGPREAALEGGSTEVHSNIWPAEEREEEQAGGQNLIVDVHHFPMAYLMFLDLVCSILNHMYCNDYILIQPHDGYMSVWHWARQHLSDQGSPAVAELQVLSDGPGEGPSGKAPAQEVEDMEEAKEAEEAEEASLWETATEESEESSLWEMAQEPAAPEEITKSQDENSKKEVQDTEIEEKEEKNNKKKNQKRIWTQQRTDPETPVWKTRKLEKEGP